MTKTPTTPVAFSGNDAHNANYIVYMNGIEVPTKSVSQRYGVWQIPEMSIEMVADPVLTRLGAEDRIQVAVFDLDDVIPSNSKETPQFRLFGEGEITGWGYTNTHHERSITFTAVNQFAIFTQLFVQFVTNVDDMLGYYTRPGKDVTVGANVTSELIFPYSLFTKGLVPPRDTHAPSTNASTQNPDQINRPFDFLYNVVRCLTSQVPERAVPAANFFSRWARLTNFINRFAGSPVFDEPNISAANPNTNIFPILKALQTTSAVDVITTNLIPQIQNSGSFYDMIQLVYQMVFMEVAMIPTMPLVTVDLATSIVETTDFAQHRVVYGAEIGGVENPTTQTSVPVQKSVQLDKAVPAEQPNPLKPKRIQNYFPKPQFLFGLPPTCNVFFPSQVKMLQYQENYATQPTRLYFNDEVLNRVMKQQNDGLGESMMNALSTAYPPEADAANKARVRNNPKSTGKNFLLFPEEFYKGPVMDRRPIPTWLYFLRQNEQTKKNKTDGASQTTTPTEPPAAQQDLFDQLRQNNPDVYQLYAGYEYFRERFAQRSGSVTLTWNAYPVPGFPMAVFDQRATRVDLFAYITTVQQAMTHRSRQTTVSFTYARTVQEMFGIMAQTFAEGSPAYGAGPREPVRDIRQVIQSFTDAEAYYQKLFFGNQRLYNKDAAFDWRKIIAYAPVVSGDEPENIFVEGGNEAAWQRYNDAQELLVKLLPQINDAQQKLNTALQEQSEAQRGVDTLQGSSSTVDTTALKAAQDALTTATQQVNQYTTTLTALENQYNAALAVVHDTNTAAIAVSHNLVDDREIVPTRDAEKYFDNEKDAIQYNWRPRCTLDEYIIFYNSAGEGEIPAFNHPRSLGAHYYERIRRLTVLTPDTKLPAGADGLNANVVPNPDAATQSAPAPGTGTTTTPPSTKPVVPGLGADFPQSRADWNTILEAYRNNVYNTKVPRT